MNFRLTLPASQIPDGSTVFKTTGTTAYKLVRAIKVYSEDPELRTVVKNQGVCYLQGGSSSFTAIPDTFLLSVEMSAEAIRDLMEEIMESRESHQ